MMAVAFWLGVIAILCFLAPLADYVAYRKLRRAARMQERRDQLRAQVRRIQAASQARGWVTRAEAHQLMAADREERRHAAR